MNLIKYCPLVTVSAISCLALPAQAFSIAGNSLYTLDGLPTELSVNNEVQIPDGDTRFTVSDPDSLNIGSLFLEGFLGDFSLTEDAIYAPVLAYITGFEFLGQAAILNLDAGQDVLTGFVGGSNFTIDSELSGNITDLSGTLLGTAVGSFSSVQTGSQIGNFSISLDGTPITLDPTTTTPVPSPGLLPGFIGLAIGVLRKRNNKFSS